MATTGGLTNFSKDSYLNHIFGGATKSVSTNYLGFTTGSSNEAGAGAEPFNGNYSRIPILPSLSNPVSGGKWENSVDIESPMASDNWGNIVGVALFDSSVGGNALAYWNLASIEMVKRNGKLVILAGGLKHEFTDGLLSTYTQNLILENLYRQSSMPIFPTLYHASYTTAATAELPGTEPTVGDYARVAIANNSSSWNLASSGVKTNNNNYSYPKATADWGTLVNFGLHTEASGGIYIAGGVYGTTAEPDPVEIKTNDELIIGAGQLTIKLQ